MTSSTRSHAERATRVGGLPAERFDAATAAGNRIARRLKKFDAVRACQVRCEFIATDTPGPTNPPMLFMLRGGRGERGGQGGEVRLKLYLSMLWMASGHPHDVTHPAYSWARLLGLDDPDGNGKRRVLDAIDWLEANAFIQQHPNRGRPSTIRLLSDTGTGEPYSKPSPASGGRPTYRRLNADWWCNGWLATLSGRAIVVALAFLDASGAKTGDPAWITPSRTRTRYGMSNDTRQKGLRELRDWGLIATHRTRNREPFGHDHTITTYALHLTGLAQPPTRATRLLAALQRHGALGVLQDNLFEPSG